MKLSVKNLSFSFHGSIKIFDRLSFEITTKKCLHIKGANGSGKTTLLRIIAGLQDYHKGDIILTDTSNAGNKTNCEFLATEKNGLFPNLSAIENLRFWSQMNQQSFEITKLLQQASQWGLNHRYCLEKVPIKKFSTGMKRKIALIKIFQSPAKLLLLDEPTNGLDQESIKVFIKYALEAKMDGKILIISSHHNSKLYQEIIDETLTVER